LVARPDTSSGWTSSARRTCRRSSTSSFAIPMRQIRTR
jgi:hypothetical protein